MLKVKVQARGLHVYSPGVVSAFVQARGSTCVEARGSACVLLEILKK